MYETRLIKEFHTYWHHLNCPFAAQAIARSKARDPTSQFCLPCATRQSVCPQGTIPSLERGLGTFLLLESLCKWGIFKSPSSAFFSVNSTGNGFWNFTKEELHMLLKFSIFLIIFRPRSPFLIIKILSMFPWRAVIIPLEKHSKPWSTFASIHLSFKTFQHCTIPLHAYTCRLTRDSSLDFKIGVIIVSTQIIRFLLRPRFLLKHASRALRMETSWLFTFSNLCLRDRVYNDIYMSQSSRVLSVLHQNLKRHSPLPRITEPRCVKTCWGRWVWMQPRLTRRGRIERNWAWRWGRGL